MFLRIILLMTLIAAVCSAGNIFVNPSFESGLDSWSSNGFGAYNDMAHSGDYSAATGCVGSGCMDQTNGAYIRQTLPTVAGQYYTLSFWVTESYGPTSEMAIYWNGSLVQDILNPNNNGGNAGWIQYTFSDLYAASNSTVLQVNGRQDPAGIFFDDFYADVSGVPEPATFGFVGLALALLAIGVRHRQV
jgi:hypothetical protein